MKCEEACLAISDRLDGALEPEVAPELAEHVASCEACRTEEGEFARLDMAMRAIAPPAVPSDLRKNLERSFRDEAPPWRLPLPDLRWVAAGAAAIALAFFALRSFSVSLKEAPRPSRRSAAAGSETSAGAEEPLPGGGPVPAGTAKRQVRIDAAVFEALEALRQRVSANPGRREVLDALDRAGLFLEEAAAASESEPPDFTSVKEQIGVSGVIGIVRTLANDLSRAGDAEGSEEARNLLAALRSVLDA